jgi:hypothetical protein
MNANDIYGSNKCQSQELVEACDYRKIQDIWQQKWKIVVGQFFQLHLFFYYIYLYYSFILGVPPSAKPPLQCDV